MSETLNAVDVKNVGPRETWYALESDKDAVLIDVRTAAEWTFVGAPKLQSLAKTPVFVEWQTFPSMAMNPDFVSTLSAALAKAGHTPASALYFLCRSGARSRSAAAAMMDAGWSNSFNVDGGFEGISDTAGRRGAVNGWKACDLPWSQS